MSSPAAVRATTRSVEETRSLAAALAELARPGDLLLLIGDLGAGKTAFTQGFGRGLGVDEQITSPTFALVQGYTGRLVLHHLDVYRLVNVAEATDLGISELLDEDAVTLIEWGDTITRALPRDYLEVHIDLGDDADDADVGGDADDADDAGVDVRSIVLNPVGGKWQARCRAMSVAVAAWTGATGSEEGDLPC